MRLLSKTAPVPREVHDKFEAVEFSCLAPTSIQAHEDVGASTNIIHPVKTITSYCKFADKRGEFLGILNSGNWQEINLVQTNESATRGGHYHRKATEIIFLIEGQAQVILAPYDDLERSQEYTLEPSHGIQIPPYTAHRFIYQAKSKHLQLLDLRFDPMNEDLFAVDNSFGCRVSLS